ncbi:tyrosine-type recombinase/integrase, partial [Liquorilactobacillus satsumensis]|uniref:tyrosine-type recombinase/integrase n=1 Tax=Liquorilactobacillus satsumensis TaxID=259059 RepID=UPI0039EC53BD
EYGIGYSTVHKWIQGQAKHITVNGVYQIFQKLGREMDKPWFGTHTLRKTFGYHYYQRTHDIATLMVIFNHSSQQITKRYIGVTDDEINQSLNSFRLG